MGRYASKVVDPLTQSQINQVIAQIPPPELTPEQITEIATQVPPTDISGKVDKVTAHSLVADTEISKIHLSGSDNQDLSGLQPKETGKGLYPDADASKLAGIAAGAEVNVNADWNAVSGDAAISNKPAIPVVSDTVYGVTWDNNTDAPSKNAIYDKIETMVDVVYPATVLTVTYGTLDTGVVGDLAAVGGTPVNISEEVGANALQVQLDFPNIVQLDGFAFYGRYAGGAGHVIQVEIYNGSTWDALGQFGSTAASQWYSFNIYSPSTYIIIGTVKVRFRHLQNGIGTHDLILDYVELNHGGGGAGGTILQASSITFNPVGSIASTNVQAAIEELDSEHPVLTTGVHGAGTGEVIDRSLINFATHEFMVKDEPLTISSGELLTIGTDNTALVWCDSNKAMAMTLVEYINSQTIIRDEPYIIDYGTVAVIGYDSKASLWCDSIMAWSRDSLTFNKLVDLNIDNLYILNTNEVLDIPADSPLERHIDRKLIDSRVLWIN